MSYTILLLEESIKDIEAICRCIRKLGNKKAEKGMVINIRKACDGLSVNPERGRLPAERPQIAQFEYRRILEKHIVLFTNLPSPSLPHLFRQKQSNIVMKKIIARSTPQSG